MMKFTNQINQKLISQANKIVFLLGTLIFLNSCSPGIKIRADYDKSLNIQDYKTYSWLDFKDIEVIGVSTLYFNELNDKRIKAAVNKEMEKKGYLLLPGNSGELQLHYHLVMEDKTTIIESPSDRYRDNPYWQTSKVYTYQYKEGSLVIDMMDIKTNSLVWRGTATSVVPEKRSKDPEAAINKVVTHIYTLFPYSSL